MFQSLSQFFPLNKKLKRKDFAENKYIPYDLFSPKYNPFLPCFCGDENYYNIVLDYCLMDKWEDEIRSIWERRWKDAMKELSGCKDKNEEMRGVIWRLESSFKREIKSFFEKILTKTIEKGNLEMMKFLVEKYGEYVALVKKISVRKKDEGVLKYMKAKGLKIEIKEKI